MNARLMQVEFERLIQLINPEYVVNNKIDSDTIFYFLNAAQERFIKLNYSSLDSLKLTVENLRKNTDTFKALIVTKELVEGDPLLTGYTGKRYTLPTSGNDKFFLYLRSSSYVSGTYMDVPDTINTQDNKELVPNVLITQNEVERVLTSYFNKPILRQPCCVLEADTTGTSYITVYTDTYTKLKGCNITYIRKPKKFNVIIPSGSTEIVSECELAENVHQDIVELAVEMFITEAAYRLNSKSE